MTNEEKAEELGFKFFPNEQNIWARGNVEAVRCASACLEIAQWKDEQFINFLEWIDNVYVLRRFSDGESIDFKGLVEKFKLMQK